MFMLVGTEMCLHIEKNAAQLINQECWCICSEGCTEVGVLRGMDMIMLLCHQLGGVEETGHSIKTP